MTLARCPQCRLMGNLLPAVSESAAVNYYRCAACGHVWCTDKRNPSVVLRHVSARRDDKNSA
jgi:Zn ribbon nucleic-acid-binding protein